MKKNFIYLSFCFLLSFILVSCGSEPAQSPDQLFDQNFKVEQVTNLYNSRSIPEGKSPEEMEKNRILVSSSAKGVDAYNQHRYTEAIQYFKSYINTFGKKNTEIGLYLSISYLASKQLDKAKEGFQHLLKKGNKSIKKDAEWYLVLTLIKDNNVNEALQLLNKISAKKKHRYRTKAIKLQKQLEIYLAQQ